MSRRQYLPGHEIASAAVVGPGAGGGDVGAERGHGEHPPAGRDDALVGPCSPGVEDDHVVVDRVEAGDRRRRSGARG